MKGLYTIKNEESPVYVTQISVKTLDLMCNVNVRYHRLCKDLESRNKNLIKENQHLLCELEQRKRQVKYLKLQVGRFIRGEKHLFSEADFEEANLAVIREETVLNLKHGVVSFIQEHWAELSRCFCLHCTDGITRMVSYNSSRKCGKLICDECSKSIR